MIMLRIFFHAFSPTPGTHSAHMSRKSAGPWAIGQGSSKVVIKLLRNGGGDCTPEKTRL